MKMRGPVEQIEQLRSENIRVVADLKDYNTSVGQYMPYVRISADGFPDVGAIGDYTVSIEIRKEEA